MKIGDGKWMYYLRMAVTFVFITYIMVTIPLLTLTSSDIGSTTLQLDNAKTAAEQLEMRLQKLQAETRRLHLQVTRMEETVLNVTFMETFHRTEKLYKDLYAQVASRLAKTASNFTSNINATRLLYPELRENMRFLRFQTGKIRSLHRADRLRQHQELSERIQQRIFAHQNPPNCESTRKLICDLSLKPCGFGCQIHYIAICLIASLALNRTMILRSKPWNYSPNGWEAFFQPVTSCKYENNGPLQIYPPDGDEKNYPVLLWPLYPKPIPKWLPYAVPADILPLVEMIHEDPGLWWIGQVLFYLFRLQPNISVEFEEELRKENLQTPCVGIHIRRTDKLLEEAKSHSLNSYVAEADEYWKDTYFDSEKSAERRVFLASDDSAALRQFHRKFKDSMTIYGQSKPNKFSGSLQTRYSEKSLLEVVRDIWFLSRTSYLVCTFSSLICKMAYALQQVHEDTSKNFESLDDNYWFPGGNGRQSQVIFGDVSRNGSLELKEGDVITNDWSMRNGFGKGKNERTGKEGFYPSFKSEEIRQMASFSLFS